MKTTTTAPAPAAAPAVTPLQKLRSDLQKQARQLTDLDARIARLEAASAVRH